MEVPVDAFVETINHWNEMCAPAPIPTSGYARTMMMTIDQLPFYATGSTPTAIAPPAALIVDTECRVLTKRSPAHPACFAAGITSGGMFYNIYPHNLNCLSRTQLPDGPPPSAGARRQGSIIPTYSDRRFLPARTRTGGRQARRPFVVVPFTCTASEARWSPTGSGRP